MGTYFNLNRGSREDLSALHNHCIAKSKQGETNEQHTSSEFLKTFLYFNGESVIPKETISKNKNESSKDYEYECRMTKPNLWAFGSHKRALNLRTMLLYQNKYKRLKKPDMNLKIYNSRA
jgi:hypothetical protein